MTIFLILAIYLLAVQFFVSEVDKKKKSFFAALGLVAVLALRAPSCGLDVTGSTFTVMPNSYGGVFLTISDYSIGQIIQNPTMAGGHMEVGWLLLTKLISLITKNLQIYLIIIAVLQFIPIAYLIGKYSKNVVLSYFIFACLGFYVHYFSGIRQMMAVSIILLSFDMLYQKRYLWFFIISVLASTIHSSSIFFLIMWPLSKIKLSFITSSLCIIAMLLLMPVYNIIVSDAINFLFEDRYEDYVRAEGSAITMFVVYALFILISFINKNITPLMRLLRMTVIVGVAGQSLGVLGDNAITRIGYYFNIFLILLLPEIVAAFKNEETRKIISVISIILLCVFFVLTTSPRSSSGVIPYAFFWERIVLY